jgi:hypothetical protein
MGLGGPQKGFDRLAAGQRRSVTGACSLVRTPSTAWVGSRGTYLRVECYAKSLPQQGRTCNEDASLVVREPVPIATVCEGRYTGQRGAGGPGAPA